VLKTRKAQAGRGPRPGPIDDVARQDESAASSKTNRTQTQAAFTVTFRGAAGGAGVRALRALLKAALRRYGLRAHCQELRRKDDGGGA
jgi:hypothetical protein